MVVSVLKLAGILLIWMMDFEAPRIFIGRWWSYYRFKGTGKRVFRHNQSTADRQGPALPLQGFTAGNPEAFARVSRIGEDLAPSLDS